MRPFAAPSLTLRASAQGDRRGLFGLLPSGLRLWGDVMGDILRRSRRTSKGAKAPKNLSLGAKETLRPYGLRATKKRPFASLRATRKNAQGDKKRDPSLRSG